MEDWGVAGKPVSTNRERQLSKTALELHELLSGRHHFTATSHARPTYCNICRDALSGVTSHGLSCEVCKWKVHKRCASKAINNCKWTTLASVGKEIIEDRDRNIYMPHQWMEGNLPVSSKCAVCEKTCGSVLRLQDWRCLWCRGTVHTACRPNFPAHCDLGPNRVSVVPPTALHSVGLYSGSERHSYYDQSKEGQDEAWEAVRPQGCSPLLVFVNSKSGDNQGVKFLRRFKQLLNPAQVFDLIPNGPQLGLQLFRRFDPFRILVCSGDGSVGWVLSEIDKFNITNQCQVGVLPLGTGNDLARVLGWGASCDDDANLTHLLDKYEKATTKILDRWSIMTFERPISCSSEDPKSAFPNYPTVNITDSNFSSFIPTMKFCENSVVFHLSNILESNEHPSIIESAKVLCETVKEFINRASEISMSQGDEELNKKCLVIREKMDQLINTLHEEGLQLEDDGFEKHSLEKPEKDEEQKTEEDEKQQQFDRLKLSTQEKLKMRANSLKRAVRQLIEHSEKIIDEQNITKEFESIPDPDWMKLGPICLSPLPSFRRDSNCSTSDVLNMDLPVPHQFADSRRSSASRLPSPLTVGCEGEESMGEGEKVRVIVDIEKSKELLEEMEKDDPGEEVPMFYDEDRLQDTDDGILSGLKLSKDLANIGHIDSSETSDDSPEGTNELLLLNINENNTSRLMRTLSKKNRQSLKSTGSCENIDATNLISTSPDDDDDYDDFTRELGLDNSSKRCSIAHFIEGNDIARRSIKCRHKKLSSLDDLDLADTPKDPELFVQIPTIQISSSENEYPLEKKSHYLQTGSGLPSFLDVVQLRIQGSNNNIRGSTDGMYLSDFQESHRKSLALSETDDEELVRFHTLTRSETMQGQGGPPRVVIDPPSPTGEETPTRRFSYDCCRKLSAASPCALLKTEPPPPLEVGKPVFEKKLPIINPLVRLPTWPNVSTGSGLISKVLLANADALCAAAVPLMDPQESIMEGFRERCVMNNYFGIGIDAKITLDFHQKREEHPEKCRSRAKNYMWYGVLGSKEFLQKTYKNLEQRVQLECDGQRIPLPSLQGIVILNIPSFMGGTNFWGGTKEGEVFLAPSVDDQILEVVAVFGSVQMAASRLINLQHHRIAQCHTVQINITGEEGVPIQVDGEAWVQPPGMIRIIHKNRMRMLCRNRALETSLKSWQEKQRHSKLKAPLPHSLSQNEMQMLITFIEATTTLVKCVKLLIIKNPSIEAEVYELADRTASNLEKVHPSGKILQGPDLRLLLTSLVSSARDLHEEACLLLKEKADTFEIGSELESQLGHALSSMETELRKCHISETGQALVYLQQLPDDRKSKKGLSWLKFRKEKYEKGGGGGGDLPKGLPRDISSWGVHEVSSWLEWLQLGEYSEAFIRHDIRGQEVTTLTRRDLKDLGVTKVGHVKRLLLAVKELANYSNST